MAGLLAMTSSADRQDRFQVGLAFQAGLTTRSHDGLISKLQLLAMTSDFLL